MTEVGIGIANDRGSMNDGHWKWDSRKKKVTIDPRPDPPHLAQVLIDGGTRRSYAFGAASETTTEIILTVEHNLGFKPQVLSYFYCYDITAGTTGGYIGLYSFNGAPMIFNAFPRGSEWLWVDVDTKYMYIKHTVAFGSNPSPGVFTFAGSNIKYRLKYMITNQRRVTPVSEFGF